LPLYVTILPYSHRLNKTFLYKVNLFYVYLIIAPQIKFEDGKFKDLAYLYISTAIRPGIYNSISSAIKLLNWEDLFKIRLVENGVSFLLMLKYIPTLCAKYL